MEEKLQGRQRRSAEVHIPPGNNSCSSEVRSIQSPPTARPSCHANALCYTKHMYRFSFARGRAAFLSNSMDSDTRLQLLVNLA